MTVSRQFAQRHRQKWRASLRYGGRLLLISVLLVAVTVAPLYLGWWESALPAAFGSAIAALLLFAVVVNVPLEAFAFVRLIFDREVDPLPCTTHSFGRALYGESGRFDAMAGDAGLPLFSDFESPDPLDTRELPVWHAPDSALPTIQHLLAQLDPGIPLHRHIECLRDALLEAQQKGARFYFLVATWAGGTNARVEALRRGDSRLIEELRR